jgi:hypothetical protein
LRSRAVSTTILRSLTIEMNWDRIVLGAKDLLGLLLVVRLLRVQLHGVYKVFCVFVFYECAGSSIVLLQSPAMLSSRTYYCEWLVLSAAGWVITLWMIYALMEAVLTRLPGILKFSRRLLNYSFVGSVAVALFTAKSELTANTIRARDWLISAVNVGMVLERVIATIVLLVILAIFCFVLWFPVKMPRNLVVFGLGLVVYFSCRNVLVLVQEFMPRQAGTVAAEVSMVILTGCFCYWAICLNREGESAEVSVGHAWRSGDQQKLLDQLESMNAALLRSARH